MSVRRTEHYHNTDEQTSDYITRAVAIVQAIDMPDELRPAALTAAIGLVSGKQLILEPLAPMHGLAIPKRL